MNILVIADHDAGHLLESTSRVVTAATMLGGDISLLVAGSGCDGVAADAATMKGVSKVLLADDGLFEHQLAEPLGSLIAELAGDFDAVLSSASSTAKNIMPRVAALLDVMQVSEVIEITAPDTFRRPIYAGNAIETVQSLDAKKVLTVRASSFAPAASDGPAVAIETVRQVTAAGEAEFIRLEESRSDRPSLQSARVVVAGGRALGSKEQFDTLIGNLADKLNAAIGASRAAVDAGYAANDLQVGQTGKVVAPELYIACGISGAIQHLAGMKDSRVVVAINSDADAPIFQVADYGLVGDIFEILPAMTDAL